MRKKSNQWFGSKLRDAVETHEEKNWPTPRTGNPSSRKKGTGGKVLNEEVKNWATPNTMDYLPPKEGESQERIFRTHRKGRKEPCNLRVGRLAFPTRTRAVRVGRTPDG